jgi:glycosyltransferase involved in cell wall biosynthesis
MKHRILYIAVYDPHVPYTGTGARGGEFVTNLAKRFGVDLVYMEGSGHRGDRELENTFSERVSGVGHKIRVPFSKTGYFIFSRKILDEAEDLISRNTYSAVLADYGMAGLYGIRLNKEHGLPFIYCSHNIEFRQHLGKARQDPRRLLTLFWVHHIEKKSVQSCDLLVPISESDAEFYTRWTDRGKMHVVPQCFNENLFNPFYKPPKNRPKIVLFYGNYNISTNRDAVSAAYDRVVDKVAKRFPNVVFRFIGANPPRDIRHPRMEFPGFVEHIEEHVKSCDVVISPIRAGWGFPTKIIEALACGKPIVATEAAARTIPRKYRTLKVVSMDRYADAVISALTNNRPCDPIDFEILKKEYTWSGAVSGLSDRIEAMLENVRKRP